MVSFFDCDFFLFWVLKVEYVSFSNLSVYWRLLKTYYFNEQNEVIPQLQKLVF